MDTTVSFTFQARRYVPPELEQHNSSFTNATGPWVMSAGRWDTHVQAVQAAGEWLLHEAEETPQQYELQIVQVEEIDLLEGVSRG